MFLKLCYQLPESIVIIYQNKKDVCMSCHSSAQKFITKFTQNIQTLVWIFNSISCSRKKLLMCDVINSPDTFKFWLKKS